MGFCTLSGQLKLTILQSTAGPTSRGTNSRNADSALSDPYLPESQCSGYSDFSQSQYSDFSQSSQKTQGPQTGGLRKTRTGGGAWNAPIAHVMITETSGQTYGFGVKTEEDRYHRLAEEARRWVLGPMPPRTFLDTFLAPKGRAWQAHQGKMPTPEKAFDDVPEVEGPEKDIYEPLVSKPIFWSYELYTKQSIGKSHEWRAMSGLYLLHHFGGSGQEWSTRFDGKQQTRPFLLRRRAPQQSGGLQV